MLNEAGRGDERPVRVRRVAIPVPLARVIAVPRQIERCDLVVFAVFEDAPHRQSSGGHRARQIDIPNGRGWRPELTAFVRVEDVDAPHLQPAAIAIADVEAVRLRHFAQRGFEQNDGVVVFAPLVRSGESGICRQNPNDEPAATRRPRADCGCWRWPQPSRRTPPRVPPHEKSRSKSPTYTPRAPRRAPSQRPLSRSGTSTADVVRFALAARQTPRCHDRSAWGERRSVNSRRRKRQPLADRPRFEAPDLDEIAALTRPSPESRPASRRGSRVRDHSQGNLARDPMSA